MFELVLGSAWIDSARIQFLEYVTITNKLFYKSFFWLKFKAISKEIRMSQLNNFVRNSTQKRAAPLWPSKSLIWWIKLFMSIKLSICVYFFKENFCFYYSLIFFRFKYFKGPYLYHDELNLPYIPINSMIMQEYVSQ